MSYQAEKKHLGRESYLVTRLEERIALLEYSICLVAKKVEEIERRFPQDL